MPSANTSKIYSVLAGRNSRLLIVKFIFSFLFFSATYSSIAQLFPYERYEHNWWQDYSAVAPGFRQAPELFIIYPDSHLVNLYADSVDGLIQKPVKWCSIGQNYDPYTTVWEKKANRSIYPENTIESVVFNYAYFRENEDTSIVDTIILQFFGSIDSTLFSGKYKDSLGLFTVPEYDTVSGYGLGAQFEMKIPLGAGDATPERSQNDYDPKTLQVNLSSSLYFYRGESIHMTMHFKPGQEYFAGDTLYFDTSLIAKGHKAPMKRLNRFGVLVSVQDGKVKYIDTTYNNGSFISKDIRYRTAAVDSNLKGKYLPHIFKDDSMYTAYFPQIGFHNYNFWVGMSKPNDFGLSLYPNPVQDILVLKLDQQNVSFLTTSVLSLSGQILLKESNNDLSAGDSQISLDVSCLEPGIYFLKVQGDKGTQMLRFVVE